MTLLSYDMVAVIVPMEGGDGLEGLQRQAVCMAAAAFGLGLLLALFCPLRLVLVLAAAALIAVGVFLLL